MKLKDVSPPPPCCESWGENFPSTIGKLINKAGVKKLLFLVVFTPWCETLTRSTSDRGFYFQRGGSWMPFPCPLHPFTFTHSCQRALTHCLTNTCTHTLALFTQPVALSRYVENKQKQNGGFVFLSLSCRGGKKEQDMAETNNSMEDSSGLGQTLLQKHHLFIYSSIPNIWDII